MSDATIEPEPRDLELCSQASKMLAEAKTAPDFKRVADMCAAASVWAKRNKLGIEAVMHAQEYQARAERGMGQALAATPKNIEWSKPSNPSDLDMAFGGNMKKLLPPISDIPEEFKRHRGTKWNEIQSRWFYSGLPSGTQFIAAEGVDKATALRHLKAIQGSFEPKHEHKEAAVAWLLSLWFSDVVVPAEKTPA